MKINADLDHPHRPWAGKTGDNLIAYFPAVSMAPAEIGISIELATIVFQKLKKSSTYSMQIINPRNGKIVREEKINSDTEGEWNFKSKNIASPLPTMEDWIVSLKLLA
jgi:peptide deformylase